MNTREKRRIPNIIKRAKLILYELFMRFPDRSLMTWKYQISNTQKQEILAEHLDDIQMDPALSIIQADSATLQNL